MKKRVAIVLLALTAVLSLSACGKGENADGIKKIEVGNSAESKDPTERKYEDTNKEPVEAPDRNSSTEENTDLVEDEVVDTSGILGYWSDDLGNSFQFFHDTDENGNELEEISYNGFFMEGELNFYGTAETDNATYIKCQQREYSSSVEDETVEPEVPENPENPENSEETETVVNKEWVFDEEGKIVGYTDEAGNQYPIDEADIEMVESFNNSVGQDEPEDDSTSVGEEIRQIEYTITRFEVDKENSCTYMNITSGDKQYSLVRYE